MTHHTINIRVYYEDTDAGGVVYHANHLNFAERGRTEFLRHIGHENSHIRAEFGVIFVVRHIEIDYHKPAFLDDILRMETSIETMRNTSFTMHQRLYCENRESELVSDMRVAVVCVDATELKPVKLPPVIRAEFEKFVE